MVLNNKDYLAQARYIHRASGHSSAGTMSYLLNQTVWCLEANEILRQVIRDCPVCLTRSAPKDHERPLHPLPVVAPFVRWGMDYTGPFNLHPDKSQGKSHILTAIDYATGIGHAIACSHERSENVLTMLRWISTHWLSPLELVTDNGPSFTSKEVETYLKAHNIKHSKTSPYSPRTNGRVEKFNGVLKEILIGLCRDADQTRLPHQYWHIYLDEALFRYNQRPNARGFSPFYLATGCSLYRRTSSPTYTTEPSEDDSIENENARVFELKTLQSTRTKLQEEKERRNQHRATIAGNKAYHKNFEVGEYVLRERPAKHKQSPKYDGPFLITKVGPHDTFELTTLGGEVNLLLLMLTEAT